MLRKMWSRFRRMWFHPWAHWLGYVKPRFNRAWDFYGVRDIENGEFYRHVIACECGKIFYKGD